LSSSTLQVADEKNGIEVFTHERAATSLNVGVVYFSQVEAIFTEKKDLATKHDIINVDFGDKNDDAGTAMGGDGDSGLQDLAEPVTQTTALMNPDTAAKGFGGWRPPAKNKLRKKGGSSLVSSFSSLSSQSSVQWQEHAQVSSAAFLGNLTK